MKVSVEAESDTNFIHRYNNGLTGQFPGSGASCRSYEQEAIPRDNQELQPIGYVFCTPRMRVLDVLIGLRVID